MASAGKILITPKGNWSIETEYEVLDLVFHNGTSWLSKKPNKEIEPSETNDEYWFKLIDTTGITNSISVEEINALSKTDLGKAAYATDLLAQYDTPTFVRWTSATLNSPYKAEMTKHTEGFALVLGNPITYHTIVAWTKGGSTINFWIHQINNGASLGWGTFLSSSGGTLTGDLIIQKKKPLMQLINTESERTSNFGSSSDGNSTVIGNYKSSDDQTNLLLRSDKSGLETVLRLSLNGTNNYKIFGEHNVETLLSIISPQISGIKCATGEYTGNGDFSLSGGDEKYTVINPGFEAKIILITTEETDATYDSPTIWVKGMTKMTRVPIGADGYQFIYFKENGNELKISAFYDARYMHNRSGAKYRWVAIG